MQDGIREALLREWAFNKTEQQQFKAERGVPSRFLTIKGLRIGQLLDDHEALVAAGQWELVSWIASLNVTDLAILSTVTQKERMRLRAEFEDMGKVDSEILNSKIRRKS